MAERERKLNPKCRETRVASVGWILAPMIALILDGSCRCDRPGSDTRPPEWLNYNQVEGQRIPAEWFNAELKRLFARTKRVRILRGHEQAVVAVESAPEKIADLLSHLEIAEAAVAGPGHGCRCVPDLYLEFDTPTGPETLSPVCARGLRLGTLQTGIKWPDPLLTPAALTAFKDWVEQHGVAWECCGTGRESLLDGSLPYR
jgi:hypothetical protein